MRNETTIKPVIAAVDHEHIHHDQPLQYQVLSLLKLSCLFAELVVPEGGYVGQFQISVTIWGLLNNYLKTLSVVESVMLLVTGKGGATSANKLHAQ